MKIDPAPDGSWSLTTTAPDNMVLGHRAMAACHGRRQFEEKFRYESVPVDVSTNPGRVSVEIFRQPRRTYDEILDHIVHAVTESTDIG